MERAKGRTGLFPTPTKVLVDCAFFEFRLVCFLLATVARLRTQSPRLLLRTPFLAVLTPSDSHMLCNSVKAQLCRLLFTGCGNLAVFCPLCFTCRHAVPLGGPFRFTTASSTSNSSCFACTPRLFQVAAQVQLLLRPFPTLSAAPTLPSALSVKTF